MNLEPHTIDNYEAQWTQQELEAEWAAQRVKEEQSWEH
jgi:hypothetical protein